MSGITEHEFQQYCETIAQEAFKEASGDSDYATDFIRESADGSEYVIYYHKARQVLSNCNTDSGEGYIADISQESATLDSLIAMAVCGEIESRAVAHLEGLCAE